MIKKAIAVGIVGLFVIGGLVGILLIIPSEVEAPGPTYVSGIISVNTTWTVDDSPYIIIDNTTLNTDITLTIEAGTEIKFKDNTCLAIRGKLHVKGNGAKRVVFTNEDPLYNYSEEYHIRDGWYHDDTYYNGSGIDYYVKVETSNGGVANISYAKFEYSCNSNAALALYDNDEKNAEDIVTDTLFINNRRGVSGCQDWIIKRCTFEKNWNGIYSKVVDIYDCVFKNNTFGEHRGDGDYYNCSFTENTYGIYSDGGPHANFCTLSNNKVGMCGQIGALNNTITNNKLGIIHYEGPIYPIEYNNIHSNIDYNLKLYGSQNKNVPHNWWGTTNTTVIDQYIYDIYDDPTLGEAIYEPYLTSPMNYSYDNLDSGEDGIPDSGDENGIPDSEDEEDTVDFFNPVVVISGIATCSLATLGIGALVVRRNENWKYLLLLTFAVPLYTRIHGKKTLDNFVRGQVYGHIQSKPGTHFNDIKKTLKVGNGNLAYHLRKLEKEGFIKSSRDKRYRWFYPVGVEVVEDDGIKLSKTQESILDFIERHPKSNQKEIAKELKESQQTISYNLNVLVREGFLTEEKFKGTKRYEIVEENT